MRSKGKRIKNNATKYLVRIITPILLVALILGIGNNSIISLKKNYLDENNVPAHSKSIQSNGDGTYKLSLNVTGDAETSEIKKANVIIVLDVSGSMGYPASSAGLDDVSGTQLGRFGRLGSNDNYYYRRLYYIQDGKYYPEGTNPDGTASTTRHSNVYYGSTTNASGEITWAQYTGTRYNVTNSTTRLDATKKGVESAINTLLAQNEKVENLTDIVEISYITFSSYSNFVTPSSASASGWISGAHDGTGATSLKNSVNSTIEAGGTNWDAALYKAKQLGDAKNDGDKTYVIFFSDGNPTYHSGDASSATSHSHSSSSLNGNGSTTQNADRYAAYYEARRLFGDDYDLYGIMAYGSTDGQNYMKELLSYGNFNNNTSTSSVEGTYYFGVESEDAIKAAFDKIANSIADSLGITGVSINDPTTSDVSLSSGLVEGDGLLDVEPKSEFEYFLMWDLTNTSTANTYTSELAINKLKRVYTITDSGTLNSKTYRDINIKNTDANIDVTYQGIVTTETVNGTTKTVLKIKWTPTETDFYKGAPEADFVEGSVNWNLSPVGTLIDGVTYQVEVDVWPSQTTLDAIADAKNDPTYYGTLPDSVKQYLTEDGTLKTNQEGDNAPTLTYSDSRTGVVNAVVKYTNPEPVKNATQTMGLKKHWENDVDSKLEEPLLLDVNRDDDPGHYNLDLNPENNFSGEVEISLGIMTVNKTTGEIDMKTTGHDFTFSEPTNLSYYWDFVSETIHPMLINNVKTTLKLVKESEVPEAMVTSGKQYYADGSDEYYKLGEKYYIVDSEGESFQLDAYNNRRSFLNITKEVTGEFAKEDSLFNYTFTDTDATGDDVWFNIKDENGDYVINDDLKLVQPENPQTYVTGATPEIGELVAGENITDIVRNTEEGTISYKYKGTSYTVYATSNDGPYKYYTGSYSVASGSEVGFKLKAGWTLRIINIPGGSDITVNESNEMDEGYTFKSVSGFGTVDGSTVNGKIESNHEYTITYVNEYVLKDITVTKVWDDNDDQDGIRPDVTINLLADGVVVDSIVLDGAVDTSDDGSELVSGELEEWVATFGDKPVYKDGTTTEIVYTVEEDTSDATIFNEAGYTASDPVAGESGNDFTITNTHKPEKISVSGTKEWDDANNQDGIRPGSITVTLTIDEKATGNVAVVIPDADGNWSYSFDNLDKYKDGEEISYGVVETAIEGYTTTYDGYNIKNTHAPEKTELAVDKSWIDADNQDGKRPGSVEITLYANGTATDKKVTLSDSNDWADKFENLDKKSGGAIINYTVVETAVDGYATTYSYSEDKTSATVTNTYTPEITSVSGTKTWLDGPGENRPSVTINLLADGEEVQEVTLPQNGSWDYSFTNLPVKKNVTNEDGSVTHGVTITYTITEDPVEDYTTVINGYDVTNTLVKSIDVTKTWADGNNTSRPRKVTVKLLADGTEIDSVDLNEGNEWKHTFENLPVYNGNTKIQYTIEEETVSDYNTYIEDYDITNVLKTSVTVTKEWADNNNQDGIRPDSVEITLYADGEATDQSVTLSESNRWTYTFEDLDKYDGESEISYTVVETAITGYTALYEETETGYNVKNTHVPETTTLTVNKTWEDANNQDGIRPRSVTVTLYADGVKTNKTGTLNAEDWTYTFEDLAKKANGTDITYTVEETPVDGYTTEISYSGTTATLTNTHTPEKTSVSGTKTWSDGDNQDGIRPGSITVNLLIDGNPTGTYTVVIPDEDGDWSYSFDNLDKYSNGAEIKYSVNENAVTGYVTSYQGNDITNTHKPEEISVSGTKTWSDGDNQDGIRPTSITITLLADGETTGKTTTADEASGWSYSFDNLPKFKAGTEIKYSVEETAVTGYDTTYQGNNITNTHTPAITSVSGTKTWNDSNNQDGKRPSSITITLYADGEPTETTANVTEKDGWSYSFDNLPKFKAGTEIKYSVVETAVTGYDTTYQGNNITNTYAPEVRTISGTKTWNDADNQDGIRPSSVKVTLWIDDAASEKTATLNASNGWSYSFENLPRYRDGGVEIKYEVKEDAVEGYTTTYQGNSIINTHTPEITSLTGTKIWDDADDQDGKRPSSIKVTLLADGQETDQYVVVTAANGWTYAFNNLPKNKAGKEIKYSVSEDKVPNYTTTYEGNNIKNSYTPEITSVSVKKNWADEDDRDGARPTSITFNLTATVGSDMTVISKTVTEADGWAYTFENLPVYAGGKQITYTVSEKEVDGYTTSEEITGTGTTSDPYVITNTHVTEKINISGLKTWDDNNDENGMRPSEIYITLYSNGTKKETKKVTAGDDANNWSFEFTGLYKYENKTEIAYSIKETDANGNETTIQDYVSEVTGNFKDGYTVKNTYSPDKISITIEKEWVDGNNAEGIRPDSITVHLLADGTIIEDATVTAGSDGNWTHTFSGLNKYKNKTEINYTITEDTVEEYTTTMDGKYRIINTYDPNNFTVSGTKTWSDNNDEFGMRPDSITVYLSGKDGSEEVVSKNITVTPVNGEWKYSFTGLPKYHNGNLINYTVSEANIQDYSAKVTNYDIENIYTPDTVSISGTKSWNDADNQDGIRPDSITVKLLADGKDTGKTATASEENGWSFSFEGLTKYKNKQEIKYTVEEVAVDGYTPSIVDYAITNTHTPATISFTASKEWYDENNNDGIRPSSITVNLYKTVNETRSFVKSQEITAEGNWTYTFENLPKYEGGVLIVYDIEEDEVEGYYPSVQEALVGEDNTSQVIYNTHEPETTSILGHKEWEDDEDRDGLRPDSITIHLFANGEEVASVVVSEETNWYYAFDDLRVFENQEEIEYTITEDAIEGYETTYDGWNVINTHTLETITITVTKVWSDYDNYDEIRPESVSVDLLANGEKMGTFELNADNNWTMVIEGLYKYANGEEIVYTVEEHEVEFYITTYETEDNLYTITNTHEPQKGDTDIIEPPHTGVETINLPYEFVVFYDDRKKYYF